MKIFFKMLRTYSKEISYEQESWLRKYFQVLAKFYIIKYSEKIHHSLLYETLNELQPNLMRY